MIVVRMELWPLGDPRALESIATLTIANVGPAPRGRHRYDVRFAGREVTVTHLREDGALLLLERALRALRADAGRAEGDRASTPRRRRGSPSAADVGGA